MTIFTSKRGEPISQVMLDAAVAYEHERPPGSSGS